MRTSVVKREDGSVLCARCAIAADPWHRFLGLQFRAALEPGEGILFKGTGSIHMFFMRFPIDAIFCDREFRVLHIARELKPWRTAAKRGAKVVIEVAAGAAADVQVGDRLHVE